MQKEAEILTKAITAFRKETNLNVEIDEKELQVNGDRKVDAILNFNFEGTTTEYFVEVKPTLTNVVIAQITHQFEGDRKKWILVTRYVPPQLAITLRNIGIQFIDTAGNTYINNPPLIIFIRGNKLGPLLVFVKEEEMLGRAGLQVVFALLCKRELWNATYRDIAEQAQVALGTVVGVMKDLVKQGYLIEHNEKERRLVRKKELLDKWLPAYAEKLRPKKLLGRYKTTKPDFWQQAEIENLEAQWGGEVAAFRLTRYLKPEVVTIYANKPIHNLVLDMKLRQDKDGDVELRERFWKFDTPDVDRTTAPPLLVYADLMATGDPRNIETAKMVYNDYLQRYIEQD